ncbi:MAG: MaoC family dehydratase [Gaiellaceae bacterium]
MSSESPAAVPSRERAPYLGLTGGECLTYNAWAAQWPLAMGWPHLEEENQMADERAQAPKEWRGRFYEDFDVGDVFKSRLGRTITETDNIWFTNLTLNTNQMHFNVPYAEGTRFKQPLVNSAFTLALVTGMTVPETSENATAKLAWTDIKLPKPVFVGDTLWSESEILDKRESSSKPNVGIISMRSRGVNQRNEVVIEFKRTFMVYKASAPEVSDMYPGTDEDWTV